MDTLILLSGGFLSKLLGFVLRIIVTRQKEMRKCLILNNHVYFLFFITIATFSYTASTSKVINVREKSYKSAIFSIIQISLSLKLITFGIIFLIAKPLANVLQDLDISREEINITLITSITKLVLLTLLTLLKIEMYSLVLSIIFTLIISTIMHIKKIRNCLNS